MGLDTPLESNLVRRIVKWLNTQPECWVYKTHGGPARAGVPDLLLCWRGRFAGLEVKTETGTVTKLQEHNLDLIRQAGGIARVVRGPEDVRRALPTGTAQVEYLEGGVWACGGCQETWQIGAEDPAEISDRFRFCPGCGRRVGGFVRGPRLQKGGP